jgi:hypothetical protein
VGRQDGGNERIGKPVVFFLNSAYINIIIKIKMKESLGW